MISNKSNSKMGQVDASNNTEGDSKSRTNMTNMDFSEEDFDDEDIDEDLIDEEMDLTDFYGTKAQDIVGQNDKVNKLLEFAETVNKDIKLYFGRKDQEDSCDIYEDKWTSGKSGRELYYADLVRIAQGGETEEGIPKSQHQKEFTGHMDKKQGLGPLEELFQYSQIKPNKQTKKSQIESARRQKEPSLPMYKRKLPNSFWKEPHCRKQSSMAVKDEGNPGFHVTKLNTSPPDRGINSVNGNVNGLNNTKSNNANGANAPDFTDLLDSWTGTENGQLPA